MSLTNVLKEMVKFRPLAEEDTESGPMETLNGRRGRKRHAVEMMKNLREEYARELLSSAVFILSVGSERAAFENLAENDFKCMSANPETIYRDLASRVHPSLYEGKESVTSLFDIVGRHLEDKALEIGVVGYPQMQFKQEYRRTIKSQEDFVQLLKVVINDQVGAELVGLQAISTLTDSAIEKNHKEALTPIVLGTDDVQFANQIVTALQRLTPKVFLVNSGTSKGISSTWNTLSLEEVNMKSVKEVMKNIKTNIKK